MANRYTTPILFAFEKNVTLVGLRAVFGAGGSVVVDAINSKGVAAFNPETVVFNGNTVGSSATVSSVTSFSGLFNGMSITGTGLPAGETISSMTAGGQSLVLSTGTGVVSGNGTSLFATGGRYRLQFGLQVGNRLDTYNSLLGYSFDWRETTASASGSVSTLQLAPQGSECFIVNNQVGVKTIPATATSGSTDASLAVQFGITSLNSFTAVTPQPGEILHMWLAFRNSAST